MQYRRVFSELNLLYSLASNGNHLKPKETSNASRKHKAKDLERQIPEIRDSGSAVISSKRLAAVAVN